MTLLTPTAPVRADRSLPRLYWLTLALFIAYLCIAMALPVISVFVTTRLGYGNGLAGLAVGIAFASTILTRGMAGRIADGRGSRYCMVRGLLDLCRRRRWCAAPRAGRACRRRPPTACSSPAGCCSGWAKAWPWSG